MHAIFGPSDSRLAGHVVSICESVGMPLLLTIADGGGGDLVGRDLVTDMFPARGQLGKAFRDLIDFLHWTRIAIVYDDEEGKFAAARSIALLLYFPIAYDVRARSCDSTSRPRSLLEPPFD